MHFHDPLNCWTKEIPSLGGRHCVLSGDAAHAMPPFLGQGSNQAIQDAHCLAAQLQHCNRRSQDGGVGPAKTTF